MRIQTLGGQCKGEWKARVPLRILSAPCHARGSPDDAPGPNVVSATNSLKVRAWHSLAYQNEGDRPCMARAAVNGHPSPTHCLTWVLTFINPRDPTRSGNGGASCDVDGKARHRKAFLTMDR